MRTYFEAMLLNKLFLRLSIRVTLSSIQGGGERARRFVFVPPNLDGFRTVRKIVCHELDWLRRRFIFVPPNLLGGSSLFTALLYIIIASFLRAMFRSAQRHIASDHRARHHVPSDLHGRFPLSTCCDMV